LLPIKHVKLTSDTLNELSLLITTLACSGPFSI